MGFQIHHLKQKFMCKQDGKLMLKKEHAYYYQVQMQLALCKLAYCDFVMWTNKDLAVERISADEHFFRSRLDNLQHFFVYGIMPEIMGKWYSRKPITNAEGIVPQTVTHASSNTDVQESNKTVVLLQYAQLWKYGCVTKKCSIQWFHFECLSIRSKPRGKLVLLSFLS